jgi:hypothetical protein
MYTRTLILVRSEKRDTHFIVPSLLASPELQGYCTALTDDNHDIANILNEASSHMIAAIGVKDQNNGSYC